MYYILRLPRSSTPLSSVWRCCCLRCHLPLLTLPFGQDAALTVWGSWHAHCGYQDMWASARPILVDLPFEAAVSGHKGWTAFCWRTPAHMPKGSYLLPFQPPPCFFIPCCPCRAKFRKGIVDFSFSKGLINPMAKHYFLSLYFKVISNLENSSKIV